MPNIDLSLEDTYSNSEISLNPQSRLDSDESAAMTEELSGH